MGTEERSQHWEDVRELINKTCKRRLVIWGAYSNGQLGNRNHEEEEEEEEEKYANKNTPIVK